MTIFLTFLRKISASYKRPLENNGENDPTFSSMFPNSLFTHQKKPSLFFIFISQISYKQREITVLNQEQVPKVAKHGTEDIMFWLFKYRVLRKFKDIIQKYPEYLKR